MPTRTLALLLDGEELLGLLLDGDELLGLLLDGDELPGLLDPGDDDDELSGMRLHISGMPHHSPGTSKFSSVMIQWVAPRSPLKGFHLKGNVVASTFIPTAGVKPVIGGAERGEPGIV